MFRGISEVGRAGATGKSAARGFRFPGDGACAGRLNSRNEQSREDAMAEGAWRRVLTDCFTPEELKEWRAAEERLGPGFDHAGHAASWADYNARVQAALPLDPESDETRAIVAEWRALCADYMRVADPAMMNGPKPLWSFPSV